MPSTKTKDMLCERIYSRYGMKAVSISVVKKYGKSRMRYELSSAGVRAEIDYSGEQLGATIRSETC
jgi:threonyl-tRNA synthetase